jgi:hypothetical protein
MARNPVDNFISSEKVADNFYSFVVATGLVNIAIIHFNNETSNELPACILLHLLE